MTLHSTSPVLRLDPDKYNRRRLDDVSTAAARGSLEVLVISLIVSLRYYDMRFTIVEEREEVLALKSISDLKVEDSRLRRVL